MACSLPLLALETCDEPPVNYPVRSGNNAITDLRDSDKQASFRLLELAFLKKFLQELDIPEFSQVMVYSKTSLQKNSISIQSPHGLYFNEDTYIGHVKHGPIEVVTHDPALGLVFYTIHLKKGNKVPIDHQTDVPCQSRLLL